MEDRKPFLPLRSTVEADRPTTKETIARSFSNSTGRRVYKTSPKVFLYEAIYEQQVFTRLHRQIVSQPASPSRIFSFLPSAFQITDLSSKQFSSVTLHRERRGPPSKRERDYTVNIRYEWMNRESRRSGTIRFVS